MHWEYTKRRDGKIAITLDNNVWNFLFEKRIDLDSELPPDQFAIFIPREVEIEALAIPAHPSKSELKDYIARTIVSCGIRTTSVFGFATGGPGPQRYGGWAGDVAVSDRTRILRSDQRAIPHWEVYKE